MPLVMPNIEDMSGSLATSPFFDGQAVPDKTDWQALIGSQVETGVINGCAVTPHTGSDMNVSIAAGNIFVNGGASIPVSAVTSLAVGAASTTDRRDIVVVNNSGTVSVVAGTACGTAGWSRNSSGLPPVKPAIPASSVLLAEVYVVGTGATGTTAIQAGNLVDKSLIIGVQPIQITTQTGAYHPVLTDANSEILLNDASTATFTIDPNSTTAFPIGTIMNFTQQGAGKLTVTAGAGVTITSPVGGGFVSGTTGCRTQWSAISIEKIGTNAWVLNGDLA